MNTMQLQELKRLENQKSEAVAFSKFHPKNRRTLQQLAQNAFNEVEYVSVLCENMCRKEEPK